MDVFFCKSVSNERLLAGNSLSEGRTQQESSSTKKKTPSSKNRSRSKSPRSRGSKKSKKKDLAKGLSPPKETPRRREEDKELTVSGDFDTTQWERTRWAEEMNSVVPPSGIRKVGTRQRKSMDRKAQRRQTNPTVEESKSTAPETDKKKAETKTGTLVPGEARQIEEVRGEHLKKRPALPIVLLSIEAVFCAVTASVWGTAAVNPMLPFVLALVNILLAFGLAVTVFFVEVCRFQVKHEESDTRTTRYHIPYSWRFSLLGMHFGRLIAICASITIVALDNEFDGGSIAVLALQPLHFLIIGVQIIILMLPKRKE